MAKQKTKRKPAQPTRTPRSKTSRRKPAPQIRFGTDGWRGVIARDFTLENVTLVTQAIARYLTEWEDTRRGAIVAYDTRFAADRFARHVAEVLTSVGMDVRLADAPTPTPALSYAVRSTGAAAGVMLTASHNPAEWLGIKLKAGFGGSASPRAVAEVERNLRDPARLPRVAPDLSRVETVNLKTPYLQRLTELVDLDRIAKARIEGKPLRLIHDPMHGAGAGYLKDILDNHGIDAMEIRGARDPLFGGGQPEPLDQHLQPLREAILANNGTAGFATDGDADRIGAMDANGNFVDPHKIFALLLRHLIEHRGLTGGVAKTFSASDMIDNIANHYSLPLHVLPIGFKYIAEMMLEHDLLIGGEESGGIGVRFHLPERDGILNSLLLTEAIAAEEKPLAECVADLQEKFGPLHYRRLDLHLTERQQQRALKHFKNPGLKKIGKWVVTGREDLDGFKFHLRNTGWVLIRASGTEPVMRVYAEAESPELAEQVVTKTGEIVQTV